MQDESAVRPKREFLLTFRLITDGKPGVLTRRYFGTAAEAHKFLSKLETLQPPNGSLHTVNVREIGSWAALDSASLAALAAEEAAHG